MVTLYQDLVKLSTILLVFGYLVF